MKERSSFGSKKDKTKQNIEQYYKVKERIKSSEIIKKKSKNRHKKEQKKQKLKSKQKKAALQQLVPWQDQATDAIIYEEQNKLQLQLQSELKESKFLYNKEIKKGLFKINILNFGDEQNYLYGLKTYDVPKYNRIDKNFILGLQADKITQEILTEMNLIIGQKASFSRKEQILKESMIPRFYRYALQPIEKSFVSKISQEKQKQLLPEYIPFIEQWELQQIEKEEEESNFKMDEMSKKEKDILDKTKSFNLRLATTPNDVNLWIDFINFQDEAFEIQNPGTSKILAAHQLTEKKLSILEKALSKAPNNTVLVLYHLKSLNESNKTADFFKILRLH